MALNKVELCGVNTSKLPLLKEEEKEALFVRIKAGDEEAREEYIQGQSPPRFECDQAVFATATRMRMTCFRLAVWG